MDKSWSFSSGSSVNLDTKLGESLEGNEDVGNLWSLQLPQILEDVNYFLNHNNKEDPIPECVMLLPKLLDSIIMDKYNTDKPKRNKFGQNPDDDKSFLDVIDCISRISKTLNLGRACLDKTTYVLEKSMSILENDLCALLHDPKTYFRSRRKRLPPKKSTSFGSLQFLFQLQDEIVDGGGVPNQEDKRSNSGSEDNDEELISFSKEQISVLNKISNAMINAGYQTECCMTFSNLRRNAFNIALQKLGYTNLRMEEVYKMQWESMEGEISKWNNVVRHCTTVLFNVERKLYDSVFPNQPSISKGLFRDLARVIIVRFLNFSQAVVLTKLSPEKLFKILDMYETLRDNVESVVNVDDDVAYDIASAKERIAEAIVGMFCDLENSIKNDSERTMVPYGAVHPLTRYVMNYLKYACEYKQTLEQVFQHSLDKGIIGIIQDEKKPGEEVEIENGTPETSPFAVQLMTIMDLLDINIERKSKLYRDPSLCYVFLMNNGRYIVQKIKGCVELHESVGDNCCRRRQSSLKLYHKSYQRETWGKVLKCLNPEGLQVSGNKVSKQALKERFKYFNSMFEEIHKTQSSWMVSDEQLRSELRVSISALVIPAYRSFHGRFKHHIESSRHIDKYIKYHPEDIETLIDDFFGGNAMTMSRKRT